MRIGGSWYWLVSGSVASEFGTSADSGKEGVVKANGGAIAVVAIGKGRVVLAKYREAKAVELVVGASEDGSCTASISNGKLRKYRISK